MNELLRRLEKLRNELRLKHRWMDLRLNELRLNERNRALLVFRICPSTGCSRHGGCDETTSKK